MKPIAILNNGPIRRGSPDFFRACGGDQDKLFAAACGLPMRMFVDFDIEGGTPLPDPAGFSGVILSGSPSMVTDRHPWSEAEADWVRRYRGQLPMLGVCYGHQLLTHALGGTVDWTATGPEYGSIDFELTAAAATDPLFAGMPARVMVQSAHGQSAIELPADAVLLARGAAGIQAARFDGTIWGLQFHPEFDAPMMRGLFLGSPDYFRQCGLDIDTLMAGLRETGLARRLIKAFVGVCQQAATLATREEISQR